MIMIVGPVFSDTIIISLILEKSLKSFHLSTKKKPLSVYHCKSQAEVQGTVEQSNLLPCNGTPKHDSLVWTLGYIAGLIVTTLHNDIIHSRVQNQPIHHLLRQHGERGCATA